MISRNPWAQFIYISSRSVASGNIYFPVRRWPKASNWNYTELVWIQQGVGSRVAQSKPSPQSNREFDSGGTVLQEEWRKTLAWRCGSLTEACPQWLHGVIIAKWLASIIHWLEGGESCYDGEDGVSLLCFHVVVFFISWRGSAKASKSLASGDGRIHADKFHSPIALFGCSVQLKSSSGVYMHFIIPISVGLRR